MKEKILVVDDENEITDLVALYLENEGFQVYKFYDSRKALECAQREEMDLAVLDIMMPEVDGLELCDDYVTKPFLPLELVARVKAQLRRYKQYDGSREKQEEVFFHKSLVLNLKTHECTLNERPLALTPTEFTILAVLCKKKGSVVSAEELFHEVWKDEYYQKNNNTISVHIRRLREKMGDSFEKPKYIKTVWGCGYKIEG